MRNYRNGRHDIAPPHAHYHKPPALSGLRMGSIAVLFGQGPEGPEVGVLHMEPGMSLHSLFETMRNTS